MNLTGAVLTGADLTEANLTRTLLKQADLRYATLTNAILREANLTGADLRNADLTLTNFYGATLQAAKMAGAILLHTQLNHLRDLHEVIELEEAIPSGPCSLDRQTLQASVVRLPQEFLMGMGYTEDEIAQLRQLYA